MYGRGYLWGVTIGLCFLQNAITAVYTCCGDNGAQARNAYKVVKKVCAQGWMSVDTSSPGSLREGSPLLTQSWGQQTLCLKVYHSPATWREAQDACRQHHSSLIDLDFPGFISQNLVTVMQNLARQLWAEGLRTVWTGMFIKTDKLWWDHPAPRPVYGPVTSSWWEWLAGQPSQRTGSYGRLDLKNGTSTNPSPPDGHGSIFVPHPTSVFRLGMSLVSGENKLPYACINNGFQLPPGQGSKCPAGWYGSPYIDKCLWHSNKHLATYREARARCKDKGAELVMPKDSFYNAYVTKVILNAELEGMLQADDPDIEDLNQGQSEGVPGSLPGSASTSACLICSQAQSVDKCQPAPELNGSCPPDKTCGLRMSKLFNGSLVYSGGCYSVSECVYGESIHPHSLQTSLCTAHEATYTLCCTTSTCLQPFINLLTDFSCVPEFPVLVEGSPNVELEPRELECFTCEGVDSDEECISRGSVVRCDREYPSMKSPVCLTRVWQESRHSRVKITKSCSRSSDCERAPQDCTPLSVSPRCVYCCQGNRCNQWLPDNPIDRSSVVRRTWIGFQKEASTLSWEDGRETRIGQWNSSFGSVYPYLPETGCGQLWADRPWGNEWLVGDCVTNLPYVCEIRAQSPGDDGVKIVVHPKDVHLHLQYPEEGSSDYQIDDDHDSDTDSEEETISLSCAAVNYHPDLPVVWVKDGRYYDNGVPPAGFNLEVTMEKMGDVGAHGGLVHGLQGEYHCEVWDMHGKRRVKSKSATVKFEDVVTLQGRIRLPNHTYNTTLHSQATLLFNPTYRRGLEYYNHMIHALTALNTPTMEFPHAVVIKSYRHGSLVIDFTVFYELPPLPTTSADVIRMLHVLDDDMGDVMWGRPSLEANFRWLVEREMMGRLSDNSTQWFMVYSQLGIQPSDVMLRGTSVCGRGVSDWYGRRIQWPAIPIGTTGYTRQKCLGLADGRPLGSRPCLGDFYTGAYLGEAEYITTCDEQDSTLTPQLRHLSERPVSVNDADLVVQELSDLSADLASLMATDLVYISYTIENVASLHSINLDSVQTLVQLVSDLSLMNQTMLSEAQQMDNACNRLTECMERLGERTQLPPGPSGVLHSSNLIMAIHDATNHSTAVVQGLSYSGDLRTSFDVNIQSLYTHQVGGAGARDVSLGIVLPKQITDSLVFPQKGNVFSRHTPGMDGPRLVFTLHRTTDLFRPGDRGSAFTHHRTCGSAVSATISDRQITDLQEPVLITFTLSEEIVPTALRCVFWNYSALEEAGDWSDVGCRVNRTAGKMVVCACNHLTTFSLLIDSEWSDVGEGGGQLHLSLPLLVSLCVCIAGLGLTVITFIIFRKLRKTNSQKILFNIALAVLLANSVLWVSMQHASTLPGLCVGLAALLHYLLLVAFMWILIEAVLGVLLTVTGKPVSERALILKASLSAWGLPALIVGLVCGVDYKLYLSTNYFCTLSGIPLLVGFILPVGLALLLVLLLSCTVICRLVSCRTKFSLSPHDVTTTVPPGHSISNMFAALLLGTAWTTGYFSLEYQLRVLEHIFTVANGLFGLYIFLLFLVREPYLRENWKDTCCSLRRSESSPASSVGTISSKLAPSLQKGPEPPSGKGNIYVVYPSEITTIPS